MEYTFTLKYQLADDDRDTDALVERLGEAGCDDALVGIGQQGRLALEFTREAADADEAVRSALADVRGAVPSARLIEVAPRWPVQIPPPVATPNSPGKTGWIMTTQCRWRCVRRPL